MPSQRAFVLTGPEARETGAAADLVPRMRSRLDRTLGWECFGDGPAAEAARTLYFETGHGALLKTGPEPPFANPLRRPPRPVAARA